MSRTNLSVFLYVLGLMPIFLLKILEKYRGSV